MADRLLFVCADDRMLLVFWLPILLRELDSFSSFGLHRSDLGRCSVDDVGIPQWSPVRIHGASYSSANQGICTRKHMIGFDVRCCLYECFQQVF
jgi:hypothetical protein